MTEMEKAAFRTLLFVSRNEKSRPFPDKGMDAAYAKLERGRVVDVNVRSGDWWLTYEGERELARLRGLTASRKALRFIKWLLSVVLSGVVLFLLNRLLGEWAA